MTAGQRRSGRLEMYSVILPIVPPHARRVITQFG